MERMRPGAAEMSVSSGESDVRKFETSPLIHTSPNVPSSTSRMRCVMAETLQISGSRRASVRAPKRSISSRGPDREVSWGLGRNMANGKTHRLST
jgi:hypothetical protein